MLIFGGADASFTDRNETWALPLGGPLAWSLLSPTGTPPGARSQQTAIYDPLRDRMVVFGGYSSGTYCNDVWALSLAGTPSWSQLDPKNLPPSPREGTSAIYDPLRDRMLVFGGFNSTGSLNDVWALRLVALLEWVQPNVSGPPPSARFEHTAVYDPLRQRMLVYAGWEDDVWAMSLAGPQAWSRLNPTGIQPGRRAAHSAFFDPTRDQMVVFGGASQFGPVNDVCLLTWTPPVAVNEPFAAPSQLALDPVRPNPFRESASIDFVLPQAASVSLAVFDATGRRARTLEHGALAAGRYSRAWDGRSETGASVAAGVYFVRLKGAGARLERKMILLR